jgi:hypothetical protein
LIIISNLGIINPAHNVIRIFFGIGQTQLPRKNFSRFILMLFIWFCLIFRTCWQSMMFELMTTDMRKPMPESVEDLREMNYTIVILNTTHKIYHKTNELIINGREW